MTPRINTAGGLWKALQQLAAAFRAANAGVGGFGTLEARLYDQPGASSISARLLQRQKYERSEEKWSFSECVSGAARWAALAENVETNLLQLALLDYSVSTCERLLPPSGVTCLHERKQVGLGIQTVDS